MKIQSLQDKATIIVVGRQNYNLTPSQRNDYMGWLSVEKEKILATLKWLIVLLITIYLNNQMPLNSTDHRIKMHKKIATKPAWLNANKLCNKINKE